MLLHLRRGRAAGGGGAAATAAAAPAADADAARPGLAHEAGAVDVEVVIIGRRLPDNVGRRDGSVAAGHWTADIGPLVSQSLLHPPPPPCPVTGSQKAGSGVFGQWSLPCSRSPWLAVGCNSV